MHGNSTISVQLVTLRDEFREDPEGTLGGLAEIGFKSVEAFNFIENADRVAAALAKFGLKAPMGHGAFLSDRIVAPDGRVIEVPERERLFEASAKLGITTLVDPYTTPDRWTSKAGIDEIADRLNAALDLARPYGLDLGYHNHNHELTSTIDGRTALDYFVTRLRPEARIEVDTHWVASTGVDVVDLLHRYGERVVALHVKDGPMNGDPYDQRPVGQGALPVASYIEAARFSRYSIIELIRYPGDRWGAVRDSHAYLTALGLSS